MNVTYLTSWRKPEDLSAVTYWPAPGHMTSAQTQGPVEQPPTLQWIIYSCFLGHFFLPCASIFSICLGLEPATIGTKTMSSLGPTVLPWNYHHHHHHHRNSWRLILILHSTVTSSYKRTNTNKRWVTIREEGSTIQPSAALMWTHCGMTVQKWIQRSVKVSSPKPSVLHRVIRKY